MKARRRAALLLAAGAALLAIVLPGAATAAASRPSRGITITAVGDTMLGNTPQLPSHPGSYLRPVARQLRGDVVFGNLEGTLTNLSGSSKCGAGSGDCFAFRTPPRFARYLRAAGFTLMNDANNHFHDFGGGGETDTIRALHHAGIAQTGRPGQITIRAVGGVKVAFLGFAPYFNTSSLLDLTAARQLIRKAARRAAIVVCAIHAGAEGLGAQHVTDHEESYVGEDRGNPERFAQMAIRNGADLILGSGPHVLRGIQIYRRRLIAYSLGNFAGFHNFDTSGALGDSAILHVDLDPHGRFRSGRITSVRLAGAGRPVPDPSHRSARLIARLGHQDFGRSAVGVGGRGKLLIPERKPG